MAGLKRGVPSSQMQFMEIKEQVLAMVQEGHPLGRIFAYFYSEGLYSAGFQLFQHQFSKAYGSCKQYRANRMNGKSRENIDAMMTYLNVARKRRFGLRTAIQAADSYLYAQEM